MADGITSMGSTVTWHNGTVGLRHGGDVDVKGGRYRHIIPQTISEMQRWQVEIAGQPRPDSTTSLYLVSTFLLFT